MMGKDEKQSPAGGHQCVCPVGFPAELVLDDDDGTACEVNARSSHNLFRSLYSAFFPSLFAAGRAILFGPPHTEKRLHSRCLAFSG